MKLSRRTLMKSPGAALLMAPFYNLLKPAAARAAAGAPRRVLIFHNQPVDSKLWNPASLSGESTFTLPEMHKPGSQKNVTGQIEAAACQIAEDALAFGLPLGVRLRTQVDDG